MTITDESPLAIYAHEINATHVLAKSHAELAVVFAVRTGILCNQAKALVEHGTFAQWLATNCPEIHERTARRYMDLVSKSDTVSDLSKELIGAGFTERIGSDEAYRRGITEAVRNKVGGGSLTDLYRAYGVVPTPPRPPAGHTSPAKRQAGIYTPHAILLVFTRTINQIVARGYPVDEWTEEMRAAWIEQLEPIATLYARLHADQNRSRSSRATERAS